MLGQQNGILVVKVPISWTLELHEHIRKLKRSMFKPLWIFGPYIGPIILVMGMV
jgi:hypothetical protein